MNTFIIKSHVIDPSWYDQVRRPAQDILGVARDAMVFLFDTVAEWQGRTVERRHLMELDARLLGDTGLTRADAAAEYAKPFWRS
jgi:uncharacterized protein YjiS (DUF1127 family)